MSFQTRIFLHENLKGIREDIHEHENIWSIAYFWFLLKVPEFCSFLRFDISEVSNSSQEVEYRWKWEVNEHKN